VLGFIALHGPLTQAQLADCMGIEPPTLVGILDRMERNGWITRKACPNDRRKKVIWATPAAEPVWEKIVACAKNVRRRATQGLSQSDLALLKLLLHRVQANLEAAPAEREPAEGVA
jgi:MarR family transcriptional regulator for hemolysin